MRAGGVSAAILAALLVSTTAHAQTDLIPGTRIEVAGWRIGAYAYSDRGTFSHCAMSASYRSGITMVFAISENYSWRIGWRHRDWRLATGQKVPVELHIDGGGPHRVSAKALDETFAIAELPDSASLFDLLRKGYLLTVYAQGNRYEFNLDGTYAALAEALNCARRNSASASPRRPPPPITGVPPSPSPQPAPTLPSDTATTALAAEQRLEATTLVANLLSQGALPGAQILSPKELKNKELEAIAAKWHVIWVGDTTLGTLRIAPRSAASSASEISAAMIASDSRACGQGRFASGSMPDEVNPEAARLFTACQMTSGDWEARYIIVPRAEGGHYLFATIGLPAMSNSKGKVAATDSQLRQAVFETLKR